MSSDKIDTDSNGGDHNRCRRRRLHHRRHHHLQGCAFAFVGGAGEILRVGDGGDTVDDINPALPIIRNIP